jgi:CRISPR-associated protein Cmr3
MIPKDPLIFRDGRPFTAAPGAIAKSLPFPYPSTIIGGVRTLAGTDPETGEFNTDRIPELLEKSIIGPFLVEINQEDEIEQWYVPAPADVLLMNTDQSETGEAQSNGSTYRKRYWLKPVTTPQGAQTDLEDFHIIGPEKRIVEKPYPKPPRFWKWEQFRSWLEDPADGRVLLEELGIRGLTKENRTHVSIEKGTQTAQTGALFQTSGLEYIYTQPEGDDDNYHLDEAKTLAMVVETDASVRSGLGFLGGERRVVRWKQSEHTLPSCPEGIKQSIIEAQACRLILLTPAYFEHGYLPAWLQSQFDLEVVGAAVPRYKTVSGWDYEKNQAKKTKRLAPDGSVYFLKFKRKLTPEEVDELIDTVWMRSISDQTKYQRDGFGIAVLGTWDGRISEQNMEV